MDQPIRNYWHQRLQELQKALEANHFSVYRAENGDEARQRVLEEILPAIRPQSISWGGSLTFVSIGLYEALKERDDIEILDTFDKALPPEQMLERRRRALLTDLFVTGTNAVTETGQLVNLDMIGNRVGAITFGPRNVLILAARNKIAADLKEAIFRIKNYAAPVNAMRLDKKTPCTRTAYCEECRSPDRICNSWTITEKSFPKDRIKVVLINQDLGF